MQADNCPTCGVLCQLDLKYGDQKALDILRMEQPLLRCDNNWVLQNVAAIDDDLQSLRQSLSQLESRTVLIRSQIDIVLSAKQKFESISTPIRRLPRDILIEIFYLCRDKSLYSSLDPKTYPWLLCRVCYSWREIVQSAPKLWSTVILRPPQYRSALLAILDAHLKHSGNTPLSVSLLMYSDGNIHEKNVLARITDLAHRWSKLEIQGRQYKNFPPAFPALRTLTASYIFTGDVYFFDAPLLRTVRLGDSVALHSFVLPSHITHLALSRLYVKDFPHLKLYPSLIELHLKFIHFYDDETPLPITHPTIRCLSITGTYLLSFLILPALEDLRIQRSETKFYPVSAFLSQSGCSLKTLAIDVPCDDSLSDLLGTQSSLQGLSITSDTYYHSLNLAYRRLACPDFLSNLERIRILYARDLYPQVVHMIRARWYAPIRRLRNVVVVTNSVIRAEVMQPLKVMIDEGLDVNVLDHPRVGRPENVWLDPHMTDNENILE